MLLIGTSKAMSWILSYENIPQNISATLIGQGAEGLYHMTAARSTSWCGFARVILAQAGIATPVVPIRAQDYPTAAKRPRNSRLDCSSLRLRYGVSLAPWNEALAEVTGAQ